MERWNPPYEGEATLEVRGIVLPQDYVDFMRVHNGGEIDGPEGKLILFSLEEVLSGEKYQYSCNDSGRKCWLSSEYSLAHDYQNQDMQTVTTLMGVHPGDAPSLYQVFFDNHVVIGCQQWDVYRYDLIAIDKDGHYRVVHDGAAEALPMHAFGTRVDTTYSFYVKYMDCLYESPIGLLEPAYRGYRIVPREELEERKKMYFSYRSRYMKEPPVWPYMHLDISAGPWAGRTMQDVLKLFHNGEM